MFAIALTIGMFAAGVVYAQSPIPDSGDKAEPVISVAIQQREIWQVEDSVMVEITIESNGVAVAGFELNVETGSNRADILDIRAGSLMDLCEWEYFSARPEQSSVRRWHIVALAQSSPGTYQASCSIADPISIALVKLRVKSPVVHTDTLHPIYFVWEDCADNSFSDKTGTSLLVGRTIDWLIPTTSWLVPDSAKTYGPPEDCFAKSRRPPAQRIEFTNGGVIFRSMIDSTLSTDTVSPADIIDPD